MHLRIETLALNDSASSLPELSTVPRNQQVCDDVLLLWKEEPATEDFNITQLNERIKQRNSKWQISDDRLEQILTKHNLYATEEVQLMVYSDKIQLPSFDEASLDLPKKVRICIWKNDKRRGLVARSSIAQGELILNEPCPLATIPPIEKLTLMETGKVCSLCGSSLGHTSHFIIMNGLDCDGCSAVWCSRNCKKKDMIHDFLKHSKGKNKLINAAGWVKYEKYCKENVFVAAYSIGVIYASILADKNNKNHVFQRFQPLAQVSQRIRKRVSDSTNIGGTFDASSGAVTTENPEPVWKKAYSFFKEAFPASTDIDIETFLTYIGKFNINQISGQIYPLYSFINHDCEPNVRYEIDGKLQLKLYARKSIKANEELVTTYVNPLHGVRLRRRELRVNWGFLCHCDRCNKELAQREINQKLLASSASVGIAGESRRKSSMRNARPDLHELLKNGKEFDLEIPENLGFGNRRRTSVRFDNNVFVAVEE